MVQIVNHHCSLMRFVQYFVPAKCPSDTEIQLSRRFHAEFTWNVETEISLISICCQYPPPPSPFGNVTRPIRRPTASSPDAKRASGLVCVCVRGCYYPTYLSHRCPFRNSEEEKFARGRVAPY